MIKTYPNNCLRRLADLVDPHYIRLDENQRLINDMINTMYSSGGVGLAANQIGETKCIFVYDVDGKPEAVINPEILEKVGTSENYEGCLSVPHLSVKVERAEEIRIRGFNRDGLDIIITADGLRARVFQHEIDHLNGVLILDYLSQLKRSIYQKKLRKARKLLKRKGA